MASTRRGLVLGFGTAALGLGVRASEPVFSPEGSEGALRQFLFARNMRLESLRVPQLVEAMLEFYRVAQVWGIAAAPQSDMLLYQWGTYDWGAGRWFELDVTRQFVRKIGEDAEISQLSFKASYEPRAALLDLPAGNKWCQSRDELAAFERFVKDSAAFRAVAFLRPSKVEVLWSPV